MIVMGTSVFALEINEVEQNPNGTDAGNEWVELYSENSVDLEGYYLQADDNIFNLSGSFSGYFVVVFDKQFLDNSDEIVYLKDSTGQVISDTPALDDSVNDGKTWQKCSGEWNFKEGTKNEENGCGTGNTGNQYAGNNVEDEDLGDNDLEENVLEIIKNENSSKKELSLSNIETQIQKKEKIVLGNIENKEEEKIVTKQGKVRSGVIYSFVGFLVVLVVLLAWRKL
jgi:hypothetical protein